MKTAYQNHNGLILGMVNQSILIQPTSSTLPNRNHFVAGGPGSSKTQSYVVTNVLHEKECSIVVTDPKGEVYEMTAAVKRNQGYEVHVVNFMEMSYSDRYNSFDYVREEIQASTVANTIISTKNDPKRKDFWYNAQFSLLKALILYAVHELPPYQRNMSGVLDFLQEFDPEESEESTNALDDQFLKLEKTHPARRAYELGFKKSQEKTRANIIISLLTTIGDFTSSSVSEFSSFSDFFLGDVGKRKIALYVIIPVMDTTWEGLINLFFNQMFQELYKVGAKHNTSLPQPVVFILDEFANLGKFPDYERFLATCRGYGIAVCTIVQNITQLQEKYGREQAESILGNCGIKICLGNVNETTAKYFSELMGKTTAKMETGSSSKSRGQSPSSSSSESYSYSARNLMNVDEILTMHPNESIVLITGKYPIKAQKTKQFELFPNVTNTFRVSQFAYQNTPTKEVVQWFEGQKRQHDEYRRSEERKTERANEEAKLHESKVKKADMEAQKQEKLAMSFFAGMTSSDTSDQEGSDKR
ncbi:VirD4-like conjugal transfer protein, CD1115 family [Fictibacillus terranigra]|uniref:Type IV secretory system conjugative DNA transfer family protein n=1 Tax=Fictibacillus terranigra TaxID=3058424 RepID=A0ABT8EC37_9BACL|nr:type IV secretory system conjugative DNA transfer family protein [Fictibacillus sp. CENA-BCM004]MDN4075495.1 type IV secretory system conjugative DNA transfer family protein [Fictibacillus sp. CENA-BCM004]